MTTPDDAQAFGVALIYADERIKAAEAERDAAVQAAEKLQRQISELVRTARSEQVRANAAEQAAEQAQAALREMVDALPQSYDWYQRIARAALGNNT